MADKQFAKGIYFQAPRENAPTYVKGSLSFKVAEVIEFLNANVNNAGYVNCDLKESAGGKLYVELNTYVPQGSPVATAAVEPVIEYPEDDIDPSLLPF